MADSIAISPVNYFPPDCRITVPSFHAPDNYTFQSFKLTAGRVSVNFIQ